MRASFADLAAVEDHDEVGGLHGAEAMRHDERRSVAKQLPEARLDELLAPAVEAARRFAEYQNGRVGER